MLSIQFLINILKETQAVRILYFFLFASLLQVFDLFLSIFLTHILGEYLLMTTICTVSLMGMFFSVMRIKYLTRQIHDISHQRVFPERYFFQTAGVYSGALFIAMPGFISGLLGLFLLTPTLSLYAGKFLSTRTDTDWHTVYEYMRL